MLVSGVCRLWLTPRRKSSFAASSSSSWAFCASTWPNSWANGRLHVALHIDQTAEPNVTRWSGSFDFDTSDFLGAQLKIAESVLGVLDPPDGSGGLQISGGDTTNPEAYELYLKGSGLLSRNTEPETSLALDLLEHALAIDSNFASAHAQRGYGLWRQYFSGWAGDGALGEAQGCVDHALQLDPSSIRARLTRIRICWDPGLHEEQLREGRRAVVINPGARQARLAFARALNNAGLADLALLLTRTILGTEPREVAARKLLIWNLLMTRDYEEAAADGRDYLLLNPGDANTAWAVAGAFMAKEDYDEAVDVCEQGLRADLSDATLWLLKGYVLRAAGAVDEAIAAWEEGAGVVGARLRTIRENDRVRAFLANIHACLGDDESARREIEYVEDRQPENAYVAYRCVGPLAELGYADESLKSLQRAIDLGFLSVQLLRFDRTHLRRVTARCSGHRVRALEDRVEALRQQYSPHVEALVTAEGGGTEDAEE